VFYYQFTAWLALWYRAHSIKQSTEDRLQCEREENEARLRTRGQWVESLAVPLWDWRKRDQEIPIIRKPA
jgi:endonuclease YncB( thermonuclease family)